MPIIWLSVQQWRWARQQHCAYVTMSVHMSVWVAMGSGRLSGSENDSVGRGKYRSGELARVCTHN